MDPVVVMHVHEDGDRLSENDAAPHNYVANLSLHAWQGGKNAQGNLSVVCVQWKRMVQCLFIVDDGARKLRQPFFMLPTQLAARLRKPMPSLALWETG